MNDIKLLKKYCQTLSILYVEDDETLNQSVTKYLQKLFERVDTAYNGEEGLEYYKSSPYDIVLTDIKMPKLNGLEMLEKIRGINKEQETIILSAHTETEFFLDAIHEGVSDYIIKPIDYEQMNEVLYKVSKTLHIRKENIWYHESLHELVMKQTQEISDNYEKTLIAMVDLVESRDSYTGGHSQRVAEYSKIIAQEMRLPKKECELIYRAGMLHDIGKVTTPDSILLKPGKLSDREYGLIQNHVIESYQLLAKIPMYNDIAEVVASHHERYNGMGYPQGLKAEEIPPLSRIMIIADAFDAMTTNRIYKARMSVEDAIVEIEANSGKQFDPSVVPFAIKALSRVNISQDITQLPKNTMENERFSYFFHDPVTDVYNKEYLELIVQKVKDDKEYSARVCYLKNFSQYNKKWGWEEGDALLKRFAQYLQEIHPLAMIFRVHGDDFILLCNESLTEMCEDFVKPSFLESTDVEVTCRSLVVEDNISAQIEELG